MKGILLTLQAVRRFVPRLSVPVLLIILALTWNACGNAFESQSCLRGCDDQHDLCLITGALYSRTPDGYPASWSLLFLGCQSAYYVCQDTCSGGTSRL